MQKNKIKTIKTVIIFYAYLFVVWGFYRLLFQFPGVLEELILKPIVWLAPLVYIVRKEKIKLRDLGINGENLFSVIYFSIFIGFMFSLAALLVNYLKYGSLNFQANIGEDAFLLSVFVSFVTAFVEEIPFRGYIFTRTQKVLNSEGWANLYTSIGWMLIHLPIAIFDWKLDLISLMVYLLLTFMFSIAATYLFARTKNIATPILLHVFWQWPIILFR